MEEWRRKIKGIEVETKKIEKQEKADDEEDGEGDEDKEEKEEKGDNDDGYEVQEEITFPVTRFSNCHCHKMTNVAIESSRSKTAWAIWQLKLHPPAPTGQFNPARDRTSLPWPLSGNPSRRTSNRLLDISNEADCPVIRGTSVSISNRRSHGSFLLTTPGCRSLLYSGSRSISTSIPFPLRKRNGATGNNRLSSVNGAAVQSLSSCFEHCVALSIAFDDLCSGRLRLFPRRCLRRECAAVPSEVVPPSAQINSPNRTSAFDARSYIAERCYSADRMR